MAKSKNTKQTPIFACCLSNKISTTGQKKDFELGLKWQ